MSTSFDNFETLCNALSRNDPAVTDVNTTSAPLGFGIRLGNALQGNTHVSSLYLDVHRLLSDENEEQLKPLIQFIQKGPALRVLMLDLYEETSMGLPLASVLLSAAAAHAHLERVDLHGSDWEHHLNSFADLMKETKSIRTLYFTVHRWPNDTIAPLVTALGCNSTLEFVWIEAGYKETAHLDAILLQLSTHVRLQELAIQPIQYAGADRYLKLMHLGTLLQCDSSQLLRLHVGNLEFDDASMARFLAGLVCHRSLHTLGFASCRFNADASKQLLQFCHSRNNSTLQELFLNSNQVTFDGAEEALAVQLLTMSPTVGSLGSTLAKLSINLGEESHFFELYSTHASKIRLARLDLLQIRVADWQAWSVSLPDIVYLRTLSLSVVYFNLLEAAALRPFLDSLRRNGSLTHLDTPFIIDILQRMPAAESRRLDSYLERNRLVAQHWTNPVSTETVTNDEHRTMMQLMLPSVAQSVQPASKMAPSMMLAALIKFVDVGSTTILESGHAS